MVEAWKRVENVWKGVMGKYRSEDMREVRASKTVEDQEMWVLVKVENY